MELRINRVRIKRSRPVFSKTCFKLVLMTYDEMHKHRKNTLLKNVPAMAHRNHSEAESREDVCICICSVSVSSKKLRLVYSSH